jgi:hypothetical protein
MGSTLSHFRHRSSVLPVRSVIAILSLLHFGQRCSCMASSNVREKSRSPIPKKGYLISLKSTGIIGLVRYPTQERITGRGLLSAKLFPRGFHLGPPHFVPPRAAGLLPWCARATRSVFQYRLGISSENGCDAARFLTDEIERLIRKGHRNRMFLANIAIIKYREFRREVA